MKKMLLSVLVLILFSLHGNSQQWKDYSDTAKSYLSQRNPDKAIEYFSIAREELKKDSLLSATYGLACYDLGSVYNNTSRFNQAEPYYKEAQQVFEKVFGRNDAHFALMTNYVGRLYNVMAQYPKAELQFLEAKKILEELQSQKTELYVTTCDNLAWVYRNSDQYEKAEALFLGNRQIILEIGGRESKAYSDNCNSLGSVYKSMLKYEKSEQNHLEAKQIREKLYGKESFEYAATCNNLGNLYTAMTQYEKAEQHLIEAKRIRAKILSRNDPEYAVSCNNLANLYSQTSRYEKAEALYKEAKEVREKIFPNNHPRYAESCENLGLAYFRMNKFDLAEPLLLQARDIREGLYGKENPPYLKSCINLGALYQTLGQYEKAEQIMLLGQKIAEKIFTKMNLDYIGGQANLGTLYMKMNQDSKAELIYLELIDLIDKTVTKKHAYYADNLYNLSAFYYNDKQYEKAEKIILEAKEITEKTFNKESKEYALCSFMLGQLTAQKSDKTAAEFFFIEAAGIQARIAGKESIDYLKTITQLADFYRNIGEIKKAGQVYEEINTSERSITRNIFHFASEKERELFRKNIMSSGAAGYSFYHNQKSEDHGAQSFDISLYNRNLILTSIKQTRENINTSGNAALTGKYDYWIGLRQELAGYYSNGTITSPRIKALTDSINSIEKELTRLSTIFKSEQEKLSITWKEVQKNLKSNEAAIEFVEFQYSDGKRWTDSTYYMALVLKNNNLPPELVHLFEQKQLDSVMRNRGSSPDGNVVAALYLKNGKTRNLYDIIWKPLEEKLGGISTIYFSPAGSLHKVAFDALPISSSEVLSDKYHLVRLNTTATLAEKDINAIVPTGVAIQLYGGVLYDADSIAMRQAVKKYSNDAVAVNSFPKDLLRGEGFGDWEYLTASESEINEIGKMAKEKNRLAILSHGIEASEEAIKGVSGKTSPAILHLSTHGFFYPDPQREKPSEFGGGKPFRQSNNPMFRSGIVLAGGNNAWRGKNIEGIEDGILTAYEVSNMYLPNTKLVVLSACETGLGDIKGSEGVYGLQRAFKMAGVQYLLMSLWKVNDQAASAFMQEFYKNLFSGQTIQEGYYHAQTMMKNKYRDKPDLWAAWILVK